MDGHSYPTSSADIPQWSRENKATTHEANIRFMEYVVLNCIGSNAVTERGMVLKGGNALRFAFQSPRSTKDLDFTVEGHEIPDDAGRLRDLLNEALRFAERRFHVKAKCQHVERRPRPIPAPRDRPIRSRLLTSLRRIAISTISRNATISQR
jgi:hypothetical protein